MKNILTFFINNINFFKINSHFSMIKGSHNTMTYLDPDNKIINLFKWIYKCQSKTIIEQYGEGCRCFDLRVKRKNNRWVFAHGLYETSRHTWEEVLNKFNALAVLNNTKIYIRIILETSKYNKESEDEFIKFCKNVKERYSPSLIFFGGRRKYDWKELYDFGFHPLVEQFVGSMKSWYGKIWPWLYSFLNKKRDLEKVSLYNNDTICLFDFV